MDNLKFNKIKTKVNFDKLKENNNLEIASGSFGKVYAVNNGKHSNKRLVMKKTRKSLGLQMFSLIVNGKFQGTMFEKEIKALKYLSKLGISPNIYYSNKDKMIYVIQKLDTTLYEMLITEKFKSKHIKPLTEVLDKVRRTPFLHKDLHESNIMYNKKENKFYIIDWGIFEIKKECFNKKVKTKKSQICYNFKSNNINTLQSLFFYILLNKDKFKKKPLKSLLEIFNLKTLDEVQNILTI